MKALKYTLAAMLLGGMFASCDTDIENVEIVKPTTYDAQYYKNLRDYKASDHQIAWGWFSDYTQSFSPATDCPIHSIYVRFGAVYLLM